MRAFLLVMLAASACGGSNTPQGVCEHLVALRETAAGRPDPSPLQGRIVKCVDRITTARKAMGEAEWETFAPCAVKSADVPAFVACSPTMLEASREGRRMAEEAKARKDEAMRAKVEEARALRDAQTNPAARQ